MTCIASVVPKTTRSIRLTQRLGPKVRLLPSTAHGFCHRLLLDDGGWRAPALSGGRLAAHGRGQRRVPSQLPGWPTGSQHNSVVMKRIECCQRFLLLLASYSHWPCAHFDGCLAVSAGVSTDDPPPRSGLLSLPPARAAALRENQERCLNCHKTSHFFKRYKHPFINAIDSGWVGETRPWTPRRYGDAYRRWQEHNTGS